MRKLPDLGFIKLDLGHSKTDFSVRKFDFNLAVPKGRMAKPEGNLEMSDVAKEICHLTQFFAAQPYCLSPAK